MGTTTAHTWNEDTNSLTLAMTVVVRPPLPLPLQLLPRGFATVFRITRLESRLDASQVPAGPVMDRSTAVRLIVLTRRQILPGENH